MNQVIQIGKFTIANDQPCFVIAEAGVNHNGQLDLALELVRKAKSIGVACVKFQTFKADKVITPDAPKANYQLKVTDKEESQYEMLKKLELSLSDYHEIIALCKKLDIQFLSTPYNQEDAKFLNDLGVDAFKIASGQIVELSFLEYVAQFGKPMIISTGMANLSETFEAVECIRKTGNNQLIVLQCTTNYPSAIADANIKAMVGMQKALDVPIGYSDHVSNNYACYAAVALGAKVIEKHFTLDKNMPGPDHSASLNPEEFKELIDGIRNIELALGSAVKKPTAAEIANTKGMRRSIVINRPLKKGTKILAKDVDFKRPATGISPKDLDLVIGKTVNQEIKENTILQRNHINW